LDAPTGLAPASRGELRAARRLTRRKDRAAQRLFLTEGPQAVREALGANCVQTVFVALSSSSRQGALIAAAEKVGVPVRTSADDDLASLTDTQTPQGIVAVCRMADRSLDDALSSRPRLVVGCAEVRDPGNAGTVIRCADAFGADAVILSEGSVDAYNSKTVRSSAGSVFHLPLVLGSPLNAIVDVARASGLQVLAADGHGAADLVKLTASGGLNRPTLWLLGNEASGLAPEQAELADLRVRVPIYGAAESLNLGAAAAICLYASATAQRTGTPSSNRQTDSPAPSARS
jgi:TrmH family RNA methyltransferase